MSVLPSHRERDWKIALDNAGRNFKQGEVKFLSMDIVWDMDTQFLFNTTRTKIASGDVVREKMFSDMGVIKCKKNEATLLIVIGEQYNGAWVVGKFKNYWLKNVQ